MIQKRDLISILIFIEILLCAYLIYSESQNYGFCVIGSTCESVQNTPYAYLFDIPIAWLGFISFIILLILFYSKECHKATAWIYTTGVVIGGAYSLYLLYVQAFVLKKFCSTCVMIDSIMILIAIVSIILLVEERKSNKKKR